MELDTVKIVLFFQLRYNNNNNFYQSRVGEKNASTNL